MEDIFKVESVKEKNYTKEQLEYRHKLKIAAEPIRKYIEGLVKDCEGNRG